MKTLSVVGVAVLVAACGSSSGGGGAGGGSGGGGTGGGGGLTPAPYEGQSCTGDLYCESETSGLFCEGGNFFTGRAFKRYPCSGPMGCHSVGNTSFCDHTGANEGDRCPEIERDKAFCKPGVTDGGVFMRCLVDGGVWRGQPCSRCYTQGQQVFCEP
jgi:hypothetical protein